MAHGWSDERKAKQRAAIHRWRPWEKSSGPKTKAGKGRVAKNALKHGERSKAVLDERAAFRRLLRRMDQEVSL